MHADRYMDVATVESGCTIRRGRTTLLAYGGQRMSLLPSMLIMGMSVVSWPHHSDSFGDESAVAACMRSDMIPTSTPRPSVNGSGSPSPLKRLLTLSVACT